LTIPAFSNKGVKTMSSLNKTPLYERHIALGAKMVVFGGWEMPLHYKQGIIQEHLATRERAGLFDISHMGRFVVRGEGALSFLQHVLSNNAAALEAEEAQYTLIQNDQGGVIDDAYLFRFVDHEFLLVVNAANREKDWTHLNTCLKGFKETEMEDCTKDFAMLSLQGPSSREILLNALTSGHLPEPVRNALSTARMNEAELLIAKTGYTGEPLGFELFVKQQDALMLWDHLVKEGGVQPVGLGARDTLRLEAGLPLYGNELGLDPEGDEIGAFCSPLARFAISFSPLKGDFVGREKLRKQFEALKRIIDRDYTRIRDLPRFIMPVAVVGKGVARSGYKVFSKGKHAGYVTSGTMVPYWESEGVGLASQVSEVRGKRGICLALLDSDLCEGEEIDIEIRGKMTKAVIVPYHLRTEAPPFARAIPHDQLRQDETVCPVPTVEEKTFQSVQTLVHGAIENTLWRQQDCINLIPSEQTPSLMCRILSIMDPMGRYAEHKAMKAFREAEVFYYQGTDFIAETEELLKCELQAYLGCSQVETRLISGQMANTAVYSALVDYLNRADRKSEQRRIRKVLNHHIIKGGHLSAQPMGALRDFVIRDPKTEAPAVVNFPVLEENPYQIDVDACHEIIAEHKPELIVLGKSMILHKEPVAEIRSQVDDLSIDCVIMYDMAHVLGLVGPFFQEPFREGADLVTASTHKTFFGPQRGIIASNYQEDDLHYDLWEAIQRRTFPGSLSNHHLGTLLALLLATYEMNCFKDEYQKKVLVNAKAFATALKDCGLKVAGDPSISYTETHQVVIDVDYAKGPEVARQLEENNIIVNYQAAPDEEGFTAAGSLRMGVAEMTRFGMEAVHFQDLAQLIADVIMEGRSVREAVSSFRRDFLEMKYCFSGDDYDDILQKLYQIIS
jgi:aminomethyltransferase